MGTLQAYASYLSKKDDITLSGLATAATNETTEVVLGGSIAIPAAVVFFGVSGATAIAQSGSFNLGFATCPWSSSGSRSGTSSASCGSGSSSSPGSRRPWPCPRRSLLSSVRIPGCVGRRGVDAGRHVFFFGLLNILWLEHGFLDEWDYWAGTFGLVAFAVIEVILFMWIFKPENAWASIHEGADLKLPRLFKWVMTFITPVYSDRAPIWWGITDAIPILRPRACGRRRRTRPENSPMSSRPGRSCSEWPYHSSSSSAGPGSGTATMTG